MNVSRFHAISKQYPKLRVVVLGDFCLDRYLEIDPQKKERSLETGLPVRNVVHVRAQPGGAGTIVNNLAALGIGTIYPVGFCGSDGEGFELQRTLERTPGVNMAGFIETPDRRTFTYCKPLVLSRGKPPSELNRLDSKNWTVTPSEVQNQILHRFRKLAGKADAVIVMNQVDLPETGVVTKRILAEVKRVSQRRPNLPIVADSRRCLRDFPPVIFKMNAAELSAFAGQRGRLSLEKVKTLAEQIARENRKAVFITVAERGMICAAPPEIVEHIAALPLRGPIDIVGAGDAVTAALCAALAAGAKLDEAMVIANAAASVVIHQLGTTGAASVNQIKARLGK